MKYLVLDVGGTAIKYVLADENGEFYDKGEIPTPYESFDSFVKTVKEI